MGECGDAAEIADRCRWHLEQELRMLRDAVAKGEAASVRLAHLDGDDALARRALVQGFGIFPDHEVHRLARVALAPGTSKP